MDQTERQIWFDQRIESYDNFVPNEWAASFFQHVKPGSFLDQMLLDLLLAWRTTAYIASMPGIFVKAIQSSTLGYVRHSIPDASIAAWGDRLILDMASTVEDLAPNCKLRRRLVREFTRRATNFRDHAEQATAAVEMPIDPIWKNFLTQDAFAQTVWASQRTAFVAFYNSYETFLVLTSKQVLGVDQLRATDPVFIKCLQSAFGSDVSGPCWGRNEIQIARETRHALSHAGGRETDKLRKMKHRIKVLNQVLHVAPEDNRRMLRELKIGIDALVKVAVGHPNCSST